MRVGELLALARERGVARLDAQLIVGHHAGRSRTWLLAHDDALLEADTLAACLDGIERRSRGEPLAYLVGEREFHGLPLRVDARVLVPRPETETLVDWALDLLGRHPAPHVVDLGTGSGAIALAIKARCPAALVTATDRSTGALEVAAANGARLGLPVEWRWGDWWEAVRDGRFDLAVSNPPYVAGDDPHLAALQHEPRGALTPEGDGLSALARLIDGAPPHLAPGAWLLVEHGHDQAPAVRAMFAARGFLRAASRCDLAGIERCSGAAWGVA